MTSRSVSGSYPNSRKSSAENLGRRTTIAGGTRNLLPKNGNTRSRTLPPKISSKSSENNIVRTPSANASNSSNIQVYVRCRSRNQREIDEKSSVVISTMGPQGKEVIFSASSSPLSYQKKTYTFDQVFGAESDQDLVFNTTAKNYIEEMLHGYNCTIFAYGQTGTGKTYTMSGDLNILGDVNSKDKILLGEHAGIIPRVLVDLFQRLDKENAEYTVKISFLELYNERLKDLLASDNSEEESIRIFDNHSSTNNNNNNNNNSNINNGKYNNSKQNSRSNILSTQSPINGLNTSHNSSTVSDFGNNQSSIMVKGMDEIYIKSAYEGLNLLTEGSLKRKVAATKCNDLSSRSHTIFTITTNITKIDPVSGEQYIKIGKLNLVDLAGSENINRSGAENKRAQEAGLINKSLLTLGRVINALVDRSQHIPYRESKLTRLLQDSLGGRTKTCIIATVSPAKIAMDETMSTLEYATRAKSIKNTPQVNQSLAKDTSLNTYISAIEKLQHDLKASRQKDGIYITQDQYDLYESNSILIEEQKTRIHNMEEQLQRFKDKYVEQTEINKELEVKVNSIEATNQTLLKDKQVLISLIDEYLQNWSSLSDEVKQIHDNNLQLLNEVNSERRDMYSNFNNNIDKTCLLTKNISTQTEILSKLQTNIKDYNKRFDTVIKGVNGELESKTNIFQQDAVAILKDIKVEDIVSSVITMKSSLQSCLQELSKPRDQIFDSVYTAHRNILENCLSDITKISTALEFDLSSSLDKLSATMTANHDSFQSIVKDQNSKTSYLIDEKIQYIQKLENELQQERQSSINVEKYVESLQEFIVNNIHKQRTAIFQDMFNLLKEAENKHMEFDQSIFEKSVLSLNNFNEEVESTTRKVFNNITIGSIECMEEIQSVNMQHTDTLSNTVQSHTNMHKEIMSKIPIGDQISLLVLKLNSYCNQEASLKLKEALKSTNDTISKQIKTANDELLKNITEVTQLVTNSSENTKSHMSLLSEHIHELSDYILKSYNSNLVQISTTQKDILSQHYDSLRKVSSELIGLINANNNNEKKEPQVNITERAILAIPEFKQPQNFKSYRDMKVEAGMVTIPQKESPKNFSPVRIPDLKYSPSTPMPIPDQPLPKVLIPKSINSTKKSPYMIPALLKEKEISTNGENNLKRRFTLESSQDNNTKEEDTKKPHP